MQYIKRNDLEIDFVLKTDGIYYFTHEFQIIACSSSMYNSRWSRIVLSSYCVHLELNLELIDQIIYKSFKKQNKFRTFPKSSDWLSISTSAFLYTQVRVYQASDRLK